MELKVALWGQELIRAVLGGPRVVAPLVGAEKLVLLLAAAGALDHHRVGFF